MSSYLDGFILPIPKDQLETYRAVAEQVAAVWKAHGATAYFEWVGDGSALDGTRSFPEAVAAKADEVVVFGWAVFPSKAIRDRAITEVPNDPRMAALVAPLTDPDRPIFSPTRMVYGGFNPLVALE